MLKKCAPIDYKSKVEEIKIVQNDNSKNKKPLIKGFKLKPILMQIVHGSEVLRPIC